MVGAPLNNERNNYNSDYTNSIDNRSTYDPHNNSRGYPQHQQQLPMYRDNSLTSSNSMARRGLPQQPAESKFKNDSVERRLGEIVRTNKALEAATPSPHDVNVLSNNQQASWKRDNKPTDSPILGIHQGIGVNSPKPPGENTLRRQGKTQFKPLPKLEVLNWADGLPNSSPQGGVGDGDSPPGSPKALSAFDDPESNLRTDSRISHGGSNGSLNKYGAPSSHRRRRNSNASSMMSSELYQSEMDPSGYSDVMSERRNKKKEKAIPPPIHFDGLTSDILLQWAESVTNSSPSSSGSSSPSRLSGISSEGSLYTDEDFAQAVAAVAECGGFNMDYDYNLPGMNPNPLPPASKQVPLSAARNSKMNKIDQLLAQRQKSLNPSVPGVPSGGGKVPPPGGSTQGVPSSNFVPQISMSNYLTGSGSHKGGHPSRNGPRQPKSSKDKAPARYGTGFDDVDSVSSSSSKPLTMSNLMKHDSSLDRGKKEPAVAAVKQPLTMSNLRQHESSLDRDPDRHRKPRAVQPVQQAPPPVGYAKPPPYESNHDVRDQLLPEAPSLVTSALERHESMNSNSRDSVNSSNRHDSEVENNLVGTSERNQQQRKASKKHNGNGNHHRNNLHRDPKLSTSTVSTVRSSPAYDDDDEYNYDFAEADC